MQTISAFWYSRDVGMCRPRWCGTVLALQNKTSCVARCYVYIHADVCAQCAVYHQADNGRYDVAHVRAQIQAWQPLLQHQSYSSASSSSYTKHIKSEQERTFNKLPEPKWSNTLDYCMMQWWPKSAQACWHTRLCKWTLDQASTLSEHIINADQKFPEGLCQVLHASQCRGRHCRSPSKLQLWICCKEWISDECQRSACPCI